LINQSLLHKIGEKKLKQLIRNQKGTAEVIGTIMLILILMFFFTNVYLWHDAATKQMNDMYVQKMNTPISMSLMNDNTQLNVTNKGGEDVKLTMLWVDVGSSANQVHYNFTHNELVPAGSSISLQLPPPANPLAELTLFTVVTTVGNSASCTYSPD